MYSCARMRISYLECTRCGEHFPADRPQNVCLKDGGVLYVRYDLASLRGKVRREDLAGRVASMWRYTEVLPDATPVTLGEGFTPMLPSREYRSVFIKDEGQNPTIIQSARHVRSGDDGEALWSEETGGAIGGECGWRAGGLCGGRWNGGTRLHAEGCAAGEPSSSARLRRECDAGGWPDHRLRRDGRGAQRSGRLVRRLDAQGAVSGRRQEDDGVRDRRAIGMEVAGRDYLSRRAAASD